MSDATVQAMIEANRRNWEARTPIHVASDFYGIGIRDNDTWFAHFEWDDLGDLAGRDLVHLQCHLGVETLALARRGARTTGLDFAHNAIREAQRIATEAGLDIDYRHGDVHHAAEVLGTGRFDIVYTAKGALCYLPDLHRWARVVADLLRPGGFAYIAEFHPVLWALGPTPQDDDTLTLRHDYLEGRGPTEHDGTHTYTDGPPLPHDRTNYEWSHGIGELVNALIAAGLHITSLRETDRLPWPRWPRMTEDDHGWWTLPAEEPKIPLLYGLKATKPA
ncbi:class I SAM-dependent methyltransferase [Saccharothrix violaceirubra]|uniref:SAM-dependent methyltransferase n=1 Tax=Saccharothrix violaceirubra TaxID=413306 RepID=A0A7W7WVJ7_9PSEU|nr:class I SAM-dependent methyltransferase [Saccharothrix violaceirubra]MBB4965390.1 SAM-dependent methyltransferase [Saccharothrix violaceirubra]